jgi:hypothetical protein
VRIKRQWHQPKEQEFKAKSLEDIVSAVGFIHWQIATNIVLEIENQGFKTEHNLHRLEIVKECLIFLIQVADRLSFTRISDEKRQEFITALVMYSAHIFADNKKDFLKSGDFKAEFIHLFNQRAEEYAELYFGNGEAGFDFLRYFGQNIANLIEEKQWVSEFISEVQAPKAIIELTKSIDSLFKGRKI